MWKSKVSPADAISESSSETDSEGVGLFRFLYLKRRKMDKDISAWILAPERRFIEKRYIDLSHSIHTETSYQDDDIGLSKPKLTAAHIITSVPPSNKQLNFLLRGTLIHNNTSSSKNFHSVPIPSLLVPNIHISSSSPEHPVKRVPAFTDLHDQKRRTVAGKPARRGCSIS